jgi:hypothetical protein
VHALLWNGSADDCVDLHQFLPEGFWGSSADAIDANGMIVGTAGAEDGSLHAILWVPVPEPSSIASFVLVALAAMRRRK